MLQLVGLIVSTYTLARLIQVPIEHSAATPRTKALLLLLVSAGGVAAIGVLTLMLLVNGVDTSLPTGGTGR